VVWRAGAFHPGVEGLHAAAGQDGWVEFAIGSGRYQFEAAAP